MNLQTYQKLFSKYTKEERNSLLKLLLRTSTTLNITYCITLKPLKQNCFKEQVLLYYSYSVHEFCCKRQKRYLFVIIIYYHITAIIKEYLYEKLPFKVIKYGSFNLHL